MEVEILNVDIAHYLGDGERHTSETTAGCSEIDIQILQGFHFLVKSFIKHWQ